MGGEPPQNILGVSVPASSSLTTFRGTSVGRRSRSPSMRPSPSRALESSLARQATTNALSSFLSVRPSPQSSQNDRPPAEDLLRDLIAVTEAADDVVNGAPHGVKRQHDDETGDEPFPKRDKLGEELERMSATLPAPAPPTIIPEPSARSAITATTNDPAANFSSSVGLDVPELTLGPQGTLPIRARRRGLPGLDSGTGAPLDGLTESHGPVSSGGDGSDRSSDAPDA